MLFVTIPERVQTNFRIVSDENTTWQTMDIARDMRDCLACFELAYSQEMQLGIEPWDQDVSGFNYFKVLANVLHNVEM